MSERRNGWVKRLLTEKGFGFIRDDQDREYFFHNSEMDRSAWDKLTEGTHVSFVEEPSAKGPRATAVRLEK